MLVALDLALAPPAQAVIAGQHKDPAVWETNARLNAEFAPRRVVMLAGGLLAERNPELAAMKPVNGRPALYRCENFTCQAPEVL